MEAWMARFDDKREHERFDLNASMVYAFDDSDLFYQARMCNYCKCCMCFISDNVIEPGSDIYIMLENRCVVSLISPPDFYLRINQNAG